MILCSAHNHIGEVAEVCVMPSTRFMGSGKQKKTCCHKYKLKVFSVPNKTVIDLLFASHAAK